MMRHLMVSHNLLVLSRMSLISALRPSACLLPSASPCVARSLLAPSCSWFARILPLPCIPPKLLSHAVNSRFFSLACIRLTCGPIANPSVVSAFGKARALAASLHPSRREYWRRHTVPYQ
jgi:hypothetical protein